MRKWLMWSGAAVLTLAAATANAQSADRQSMDAGMPAIKLGVADFQRTAAFYSALGMRESARHNDHETSLSWPAPGQGSAIVMVRDDKGRFIKGGAFMVIRVADMTATLDRLKAAGFTGFGEPRVGPGYALLVIRDPDGNQIELIDETALPTK
jgi:catechol 2,3-dioxygenase-like lactoylglutathione lyase family enzyme